ncbi:MAG: hypothetical protein QM800_07300 [Paludibacter sp.]
MARKTTSTKKCGNSFSPFPHLKKTTTEATGIWRVAGAFTVALRQGELKISEANAGAKPAERTSASQ